MFKDFQGDFTRRLNEQYKVNHKPKQIFLNNFQNLIRIPDNQQAFKAKLKRLAGREVDDDVFQSMTDKLMVKVQDGIDEYDKTKFNIVNESPY